jgi:hypothetical protein
MRASIFLTLLVATMLSQSVSFAADEGDRPAGVESKDWMPISERFGFVVVSEKDLPRAVGGSRQLLLADPDRLSAELQPPKKGYFVIKTQTGWQRVVVVG